MSTLLMISIAITPFVIIQLLWVRKGYKTILALCYYLAANYLVNAVFFFVTLYSPTFFNSTTYNFVIVISMASALLYGTLIAIAAINIARNKTYFTKSA